jgi:hypothetical protein
LAKDELDRQFAEEAANVMAYAQEERNNHIAELEQWADNAGKYFEGIEDELELYEFKLDLKKQLLTTATDDNREQYQSEVDDTQTWIRQLQVDRGYAKRDMQNWENELDRARNEDAKIRSYQEY